MLKKAHDILLERYRERGLTSPSAPHSQPFVSHGERGRQEGTGWSDLKDDGYIHNHLVWHLQQADRFEEMVALLCEETSDGRNAWYEARESMGQISGYIQDLLRALEWTREKSRGYAERDEPIATLPLEVRFLLMLASLNSMAMSISGELMAQLVRYGVWSPEAALAHCRQKTWDRDSKLNMIAGALAETDRVERALSLLHEIDRDKEFVSAVTRIVPYLLEVEKRDNLLIDALLRIQTNGGVGEYVKAVIEIAPCLSEAEKRDSLLMEALMKTREIDNIEYNLIALITAIARLLENSNRLPEAVTVIRSLLPELDTPGGTLTHFAAYMTEEEKRAALAVTFRRDDIWCIGHLLDIAPHLVEADMRQQILDKALTIWQAHSSKNARVAMELVQILPAGELRDGLIAETFAHLIRRVKAEEEDDSNYLSLIFPYLDAAQLDTALSVIQGMRGDATRAHLLNDIIHYLIPSAEPARLLAQALAIAWEIRTPACRIRALVGLAPYLLAPDRTAQVKRLITEIEPHPESSGNTAVIEMSDPAKKQSTQNWDEFNRIFSAVLAYLEDEQSVHEWWERDLLHQDLNFFYVIQIAPLLVVIGQVERALTIAERLADPEYSTYSRYLPKISRLLQASGDIEATLASARRLKSDSILMQMIPFVEVEDRMSILLEALSFARRIDDKSDREWTVANIAIVLAKVTHLDRALHMASKIETTDSRIHALTGIIANLTESEDRTQLCAETLIIAREAPEQCVSKLESLYPCLTKEQLQTALAIVLKSKQSDELASLYPYLREEQLREVLTTVLEWNAKCLHGHYAALFDILPYIQVPTDRAAIISDVLRCARADASHRGGATLAKLVPYLTVEQLEEIRPEVLQETDPNGALIEAILHGLLAAERVDMLFHTIENLNTDWLKIDSLRIVAPFLLEDGLQMVLAMIPDLDDFDDRGIALAYIVPYLSEEGLGRALAITGEMEGRGRAIALVSIAPRLTDKEMQERTFVEIQDSVRSMSRYDMQPWSLKTITGSLTHNGFIRQALALVMNIEDISLREKNLTGILPELAASGALEEAISLAKQMHDAYERDEALSSLLPYLVKTGATEDALSLAMQITYDYPLMEKLDKVIPRTEQIHLLLNLADQLPDESDNRRTAIAERLIEMDEPRHAFDVAQKLTDFDEQHLRIIGKILPHLTDADGFAELLSEYSSRIPDTEDGDKLAIEYTLPLLEQVSPGEFYPVWVMLSQRVARFERVFANDMLANLTPAFLKFGQEGMPEAVVETMHDVERWWP